jgi:uncharacterized RDD family membrane protein YckC
MRCPSCGAIIKKRSMKCPECGAFRNKTWVDSEPARPSQLENLETMTPIISRKNDSPRQTPSLIEFPGVAKSSIPQWRKELGERVREVQERRAREATLEEHEVDPIHDDGFKSAPVLELLPQADLPPMNPLVVAALQRIERAHMDSQFSGNTALADPVTVPIIAYEEPPQFAFDVSPSSFETAQTSISDGDRSVNHNSNPPERVHNLAVVPPPAPAPVKLPEPPKPKRLIRDDHDPALNYLDSLPTTLGVDIRRNTSAPVPYRLLSGIIDLMVVCLLASPLVALVNLTQLPWQDYRVIVFATATFVVMGFLYLTIITALTGRTMGMRLFSLRVVDARTGLIPTGTQSAGRALVYMLSIASAGIALMFTFIDREGQAPHDRFSRTAVVRV